MRHLDLCSGIGGFALAARWAGFETVQFVEIDKWCQKILRKHWPDVPCHDDLKTFDGKEYERTIDLLTAGYPCQPFSVAGKQKGTEDERHLWPEVLRIIKECKPRFIICENVSGHIKLGYDTVHSDMENEGYAVTTFLIPASGIGAKHRRERLWIVGHAKHNGLSTPTLSGSIIETSNNHPKRQNKTSKFEGASRCKYDEVMANPSSKRPQRPGKFEQPISSEAFKNREANKSLYVSIADQWAVEPDVGRVANGISNRVDRLKGLGNAVVPQIPYLIMETIKEYILTTNVFNNKKGEYYGF